MNCRALANRCALAAALLVAVSIPHAVAQKGNTKSDHGPIKWSTNYKAAMEQAKKSGKPAFIDFWAPWCGPCRQMLATTYKDKTVVARSAKFVPILIDVDKNREIARKYNVSAIPKVVFLDSKGEILTEEVGYLSATEFVKLMDSALAKAK